MLRLTLPDGPLRAEGRIVRAGDYSASIEAEEIVARARNKAKVIEEEAQKSFESEKKRGYEEGLAASKQRETESLVEGYARMVEYLGEVESSIVEVVEHSLARILGEIGDRDLILRVVRKALESVRGQRRVEIRVHPSRLQDLRNDLDALRREYPSIPVIEAEGDPALDERGCVLRSDIGVVDASVERQLAAIRTAMKRVVRAPQKPPAPPS